MKNIENQKVTSQEYTDTTTLDTLERGIEAEDLDYSPEIAQSFSDIEEAILRSAEDLDRIKEFQRDNHLVEHSHSWTKESLKHALESGVMTIEMDITATGDGKGFYVFHKNAIKSDYTKKDKRQGKVKMLSRTDEDEMQAMRENGESDLMSLDEVMEIFKPYQEDGRRLVLEIKDFGQYDDTQELIDDEVVTTESPAFDEFRSILEQNGALDSVSIATLNPGLLARIHYKIPEVSLILNTGIFPGITHQTKEDGQKVNPIANPLLLGLAKGVAKVLNEINPAGGHCPEGDKFWTVGLKGAGRIISCGPEGVKEFVQNAGKEIKETPYQFALTEIPKDVIEILQKQRKEGKEFAGLSMSANSYVHFIAKRIPFLRKWSEKTFSYYFNYLNGDLNITPQVQILGKHSIGNGKTVSEKRVMNQTKFLKNELASRGETINYVGDAIDIARVALKSMDVEVVAEPEAMRV